MIKKYGLIQLILFNLICAFVFGQKDSVVIAPETTVVDFKIKPSVTDNSITAVDVAHWVLYNRSSSKGKLLLFLPGTNGIPEKGPIKLFHTAIQHGYQVINLSYINQPAVAKICKGENLEIDSKCAKKFRTQRIFGTQVTTLIPDESQDAIIPRLTKLLIYLAEFDKEGNWDTYLEEDIPKWSKITLSGQSQGGGMAAFIAKRKFVDRIITFSGGWDYSAKDVIASWYSDESVTPAERWYGTYHIKEPKAETIAESLKAMAVPENHVYTLKEEVREGKRAHGEAIRNIVYKELWIELFGNGN